MYRVVMSAKTTFQLCHDGGVKAREVMLSSADGSGLRVSNYAQNCVFKGCLGIKQLHGWCSEPLLWRDIEVSVIHSLPLVYNLN